MIYSLSQLPLFLCVLFCKNKIKSLFQDLGSNSGFLLLFLSGICM